MKKLIAVAAMAVAAAVSTHTLAHGYQPKHGGIVSATNELHFELVNRDGKLTVYVEDHGNPVATAGATGKLTVLNGTKKTEIPMEPSGANTMSTKETITLASGSKAIASVNLPNKKTINVRFLIK